MSFSGSRATVYVVVQRPQALSSGFVGILVPLVHRNGGWTDDGWVGEYDVVWSDGGSASSSVLLILDKVVAIADRPPDLVLQNAGQGRAAVRCKVPTRPERASKTL